MYMNIRDCPTLHLDRN